MLTCYTDKTDKSIPIIVVEAENLEVWLDNQSDFLQNITASHGLKAQSGSYCLATNDLGQLHQVILVVDDWEDFWALGQLPKLLPDGVYHLANEYPDTWVSLAVIAWGLESYQYTVFKKSHDHAKQTKLVLPDQCEPNAINHAVKNSFWVRDLINTPAENLGPEELVLAARQLEEQQSADLTIISGEDLLVQRYPLIHAVGRGSARVPQLIDLRWGDTNHPMVTLVGKGVCFDSGGLDIKTAAGMLHMKKDMGGAAHVLALARWMMSVNLPVSLRVLIPAVENSISGWSYRPGDVFSSRAGLSVEIINTDAEGRLILADALAEASSDSPDLLIDFATLTGARHVALGCDLPGFYTNNDDLADELLTASQVQGDPLWRLPLYKPYRSALKSDVADLKHCSDAPVGGGSITAALFLSEFVQASIPWLHIDVGAWNHQNRPGRPKGGEAQGLRAVFELLQQRYG